jgi:chromosome segregation ATPase
MSDLIERLRTYRSVYDAELADEAADEIERLEAKLTQDPKDARCQLYKATQKWQQEAERCNAEIERLKAELFTMRNVFHQQDAEIERLQKRVSDADECIEEQEESKKKCSNT